MKSRLLLFWLLCVGMHAAAQSDTLVSGRLTTESFQIGLGGTDMLDTYLTPQRFRGWGVTVLGMVERRPEASAWSTVFQHQVHLSAGDDRAGNTSGLEGSYNLYVGRYRAWHLLDGALCLQGGALVNAGIGFIYHLRSNANNPAQARLSAALMPSAVATWRLPVWQQRLSVRYEADLPLLGVMFSPNYGQSYYEIFCRGNYDRNVVPTTFVSAPTFRQQFTLMCSLSPTLTLSLGYLGDIQQAQVNHLKQHIWSNRLMVGVAKRFRTTYHRL